MDVTESPLKWLRSRAGVIVRNNGRLDWQIVGRGFWWRHFICETVVHKFIGGYYLRINLDRSAY